MVWDLILEAIALLAKGTIGAISLLFVLGSVCWLCNMGLLFRFLHQGTITRGRFSYDHAFLIIMPLILRAGLVNKRLISVIRLFRYNYSMPSNGKHNMIQIWFNELPHATITRIGKTWMIPSGHDFGDRTIWPPLLDKKFGTKWRKHEKSVPISEGSSDIDWVKIADNRWLNRVIFYIVKRLKSDAKWRTIRSLYKEGSSQMNDQERREKLEAILKDTNFVNSKDSKSIGR